VIRRAVSFLHAGLTLLLAGFFFAAAYYLFTVDAGGLAGGLTLVGMICVALAVDVVKENR
jgi:hypothetical protein